MRRTKRFVAVALTSALILGTAALPALAINDALVPAEDCAPDNAEAVGHPAASTGLAQTDQVGPPASRDNPGASTGAQGNVSRASEHCN